MIMKTILNKNNETISKFDNFIECRKFLYEILNEHLCDVFNNDLSKLTYDEMSDICYYMNELKKQTNYIYNNSYDVNNLYLYAHYDALHVFYFDDERKLNVYDIYCMENVCFNENNIIEFTNEQQFMNYVINELNKQITINEQKQLINEN